MNEPRALGPVNTQSQQRIVVGVDQTALSGQAVRWAAEQARLEGRGLLLVNASGPVSAAWTDRTTDVPPGTFANLRRHGTELLDRARAEVRTVSPELDVAEMFEVTDPRTLLALLSENAHLLVLGSRGRGPTLSHLFGSVGLSVLRHASCPVVVHRPGHPGRVRDGVLVAVEADDQAVPILQAAFRMASLRQLPLRVVHYVFDARSVFVGAPVIGDVGELEQSDALAVAEALAGLREQYPDVRTRVDSLHGLPEHGLVDLTERADLLVMGTHHRGLFGRLVAGSVSESVVERATCPVLVIPPDRV